MAGVEEKITAALAKGARCSEVDVAPLRQVSLVELVKALQSSLTSMNDKTSAFALMLLVKCTYGPLPSGHNKYRAYPARAAGDVTLEHLKCLMSYYESFLENYNTADTAIEGLALIGVTYSSVIDADLRAQLMESLFSARVDIQSLVPAARCQVFQCLQTFLEKWPEECTGGGALFLKAVVSIVDGEREPENVLRAFQINTLVTKLFPANVISLMLEDLFECAAGYFPVLFTPPANCAVTKIQLRDALHDALAAPVYHEFCAPLVISKLVSPSAMTKIDCLILLEKIISATPREYFEPHIVDLLTTLRGECLKLAATQEQSPDAATLLQDALGVVRALGRMIAGFVQCTVDAASPTSNLSDVSLKESSEVILSMCEPMVQAAMSTVETASSAGRSYATIVHALAQCHPTICACVAQFLLPFCEQTVLEIFMETAAGAPSLDPVPASAQFKSKSSRKMDCALAVIGALLSAIENCYGTQAKNLVTLAAGGVVPVGAAGRGLIKDNGLWVKFINSKMLLSLTTTLRKVPREYTKDLTVFGHCVHYEALATAVAIDYHQSSTTSDHLGFMGDTMAGEVYTSVLLDGALGQHEALLNSVTAPPGSGDLVATSGCKALASVAFVDTTRMCRSIFSPDSRQKMMLTAATTNPDKVLAVLRCLAKISVDTQRNALSVALELLRSTSDSETSDSQPRLLLEQRAKETTILQCFGDLLSLKTLTATTACNNILLNDVAITTALETILPASPVTTSAASSKVPPGNATLRFKVAALLLQRMTGPGKESLLKEKFEVVADSSSTTCTALDCAVVLAAAASGLITSESLTLNKSLHTALQGRILPGVKAVVNGARSSAEDRVPLLAAVTALTNQLPEGGFNATTADLVDSSRPADEANVLIAAAAARGFGGANRSQLSNLYTRYLLNVVLHGGDEEAERKVAQQSAIAIGSVLIGGENGGGGCGSGGGCGGGGCGSGGSTGCGGSEESSGIELTDCPTQSIMWRQRYFATTLAPLVEGYRSKTSETETKHQDPMNLTECTSSSNATTMMSLAAMASLVENTPTKILVHNSSADTLLEISCDLLKEAASDSSFSRNGILLSSAVSILHSIFEADQEGICLALLRSSERSAALLGLASFCGGACRRTAGGSSSVMSATRQHGFFVLTQVARFVQDQLLSGDGGQLEQVDGEAALLQALMVKGDILKNSKAALDDAKRQVRQNASQCRHYWSLLKEQ